MIVLILFGNSPKLILLIPQKLTWESQWKLQYLLKREFICRGAELKLRLIVLRTGTCGVVSHLYCNKLDVAERGEVGPGREGPGGKS